jgi:voltage-gated potassium channel
MDDGSADTGPATTAAPLRLTDLDRVSRRRAIVQSVATVAVAWAVLLTAYYLLPFSHFSGGREILRLGAVVALIAAVFVWQIRRIVTAELPELRAVEALGIIIAAFLVGFSIVYLSMSNRSPGAFTQVLDHTRALYFTISIFSTVGFGDITPRTDTARLVVSAQMLLDLVIIGAVVRLIFNAARSRFSPGDGTSSPASPASPAT